jgi:hypothetical protein
MKNKTLGIYVSSDQHFDKLLELCRAAKRNNVDVHVFFTHLATRLCTDPQMKELQETVHIALCKVGFEDNKLERSESPLDDKVFSSQSWHAEMIYDCDRYISF